MIKLKLGNVVRVEVKGQYQEAGERKSFDFALFANRLPQSEIDAYVKALNAPEADAPRKSTVEFVREVATGWVGVKDEDGNDVTFSAGGLDELLEMPGLAGLAHESYFKAVGVKGKG